MNLNYYLKGFLLYITVVSSCSILEDDNPSTQNPIFKSSTRDTLIYLNSNPTIPIVIHIPACGTRPLPAIVVLHGSGGMWKNNESGTELSSQMRSWRNLLDQECVISVFVDSYSPRGVVENRGEYKVPPETFKISSQFVRPEDAYKALGFLWKIKDEAGDFLVKKSKVGLLGFSHGGTAVEAAMFDPQLVPADWEWTQKFDNVVYPVSEPYIRDELLSFAATVSYYPGSFHNGYFGNICDPGKSVYVNYAPLLLQLAELDPLTENSLCFINSATEHGGDVAYNVYNAEHSFDEDLTGFASSYAREATLEWFRLYLDF